MTITWHEEPLRCEFRADPPGGWLHVLRGEELVAREPVPSVVAAYVRAREICHALERKDKKRA